MPRVFDNLTTDATLLSALQQTLAVSDRADFCVGYFNLRGWGGVGPSIDNWKNGNGPCRVLIGMQRLPHEELRSFLAVANLPHRIDNQAALRLKAELAAQLRQQLTIGAPSNADEATLQQLAAQLRARQVVVKLYLRHPLHAKLYLLFRNDPVSPIVSYVGSSNLTLAGLSEQGELNIDVLDQDSAEKLQQWFQDRWQDRYSIDITDELAKIIAESWADEQPIPPYHIYLKMAYHLSHEARSGLAEFKIPRVFGDRLFEFQAAAVKIAAHHLNRRNGVLIGDVVGLGKTLMATAVARIFEDDYDLNTLIICPKNLVDMWEGYVHEYGLRARVLSTSRVLSELPTMRRYRLVIIDESHNLRNPEGRRYRAIYEYISANESKCILLSATPYNKTYLDLSSQLRLFIAADQDIGIRPETLLREMGVPEFIRRHQAGLRTLAAFEHSNHADDWRDLMRLYLVRRTRSFIQENYAQTDPESGRRFLTYEDGNRSYFPDRAPRTIKFAIDEANPRDQYARLYAPAVVDTINALALPRYGLGNYLSESPLYPYTPEETRHIRNLSRAGKRLMGFCRTNLFKRLESSGAAFLGSLERHILRNHVFLHALHHGLPLPIGTQDAEMLDSRFTDADADETPAALLDPENDDDDAPETAGSDTVAAARRTDADFEQRAAAVYEEYAVRYRRRFNWLRPQLFLPTLATDLRADADALLGILRAHGPWEARHDTKLDALYTLLTQQYPDRKALVFSQFADTVGYLETELRRRGVRKLAGVTGDSPDPTAIARRFSPVSNDRRGAVKPEQELRVLVATDVLSEGQNLQDCAIVVNYDLPWAIIRLIQRAGRVDRIGQEATQILCHSFLPADGVERIINLRNRVRERLRENHEVVGADEAFFEDDDDSRTIIDLYSEKAGILDGDDDGEVDLASYAYQIWKNALAADPGLEKAVANLPDVVFSSRQHDPSGRRPEGVLVFVRTADGNDALAYIDREGNSVTESQSEILNAAACHPDTQPRHRADCHHELVAAGAAHITAENRAVGGQLGRPSGARYRVYTRLKEYADAIKGQLFDTDDLRRAIDEIYRHPLRQAAVDSLNRQLRSGADDQQLASAVIALRDANQLSLTQDEAEPDQEPRIICSLGLFQNHEAN